jgi:hypothetical protein
MLQHAQRAVQQRCSMQCDVMLPMHAAGAAAWNVHRVSVQSEREVSSVRSMSCSGIHGFGAAPAKSLCGCGMLHH